MKKFVFCTLTAVICLNFSGCWNYRGLDTIDIVSAVAVDKDNDNYLLTYEIVDTQHVTSDSIMSTKYVESEGDTIFSAIHNSKKRLINQLYGGNMQTLIISKQIAETEGVSSILESLLRDGEERETICVVISQADSAQEILLTDGLDSKIIGYEIFDMISEDNSITASTKKLPLYKAYSAIKGTGNSLILPLIRTIKNEENIVAESNGIAIFKDDRLIGYKSPEDTMLYLFIVDEIHGGILSFPIDDGLAPIALEIKDSKTSTRVTVRDNEVYVNIEIKIKLNITEIKSQLDISDQEHRNLLENLTGQVVKERIENYFTEIQNEVQSDIFGLGRYVYRQDPDYWRSIEDEWDIMFQNAVLNVEVKPDILTSGVLNAY